MTGHKSLQVRSALDIPYARRIPYENYIFLQEKLPTRKAVKDETKVFPIMQKRADKRRQDAPKGRIGNQRCLSDQFRRVTGAMENQSLVPRNEYIPHDCLGAQRGSLAIAHTSVSVCAKKGKKRITLLCTTKY
jgi:hypothetical protein